MKRRIYQSILLIVIGLSFLKINLDADQVIIDQKDADKGIVHISYVSPNKRRLKVIIEKGEGKYVYNLDEGGKVETYPLQMGNGTYKISILENTKADKFRLVKCTEVELNMEKIEEVYLNSIQNIDWQESSMVVKKGEEITQGIEQKNECVRCLYDYVIREYTYDYDKLATLPSTYLPDIDKIVEEKTGICYDFASLYAALLRSQGIPVKLVKGYTSNAKGYHAWNEVYDEETGEWHIIDITYDLQARGKWQVHMFKDVNEYKKIGEY